MLSKKIFLIAVSCVAAPSAARVAVGAPTMRFADPAKVVVSDAFWSPKFETWRTKTVPDVLEKLETRSHALENFDKAAGKAEGGHCGACFFDGLYYETLRGVSDYLARRPSPELEARLDRAVDRIVAAQLPDGYLHTWVQLGRPEKRWGDGGGCLLEQHEIYDAGALVEAGVHHYRATGKVKLLAAGIRFANLLCDMIGPRPKRNIIPTHSIAEEALVKLARLLKDEPALAAKAGVEGRPDDYLALVKFWFDNHGVHCGEPEWEVHGSHSGGAPYAMEIVKRMTGTAHGPEWRPCWGDYQMDRVPLDRYASIEGHAVRATLLCTGLASYAYETGDGKCAALASRFWESMVGRKMYVTGGVGARSDFERFGDDWELPPDAYLETCAAIGSAFFSGWMAALTGEGRYMDEFERVIYNALLTAVAEDGCHYTYQNPLNTARGERWDWHGCPCCPPMFLKLTGALPGYVYASDAEGLRVNLFIGGEASFDLPRGKVSIVQRTRYPDDGAVEIAVTPTQPTAFRLRVRVPGWARGEENCTGLYLSRTKLAAPRLAVNGEDVPLVLEKGYAVLDREWKAGDTVRLVLDVSPRTIVADDRVEAVRGQTACACGPVVMAVEEIDDSRYASFEKAIPYWKVANRGACGHRVWIVESKRIYVSPIGDDAAEGTLETPVRTLRRAQELARAAKGATVYLRGGAYPVTETLALDARDNGTAWTAYGDERPVLTGACRIPEFAPVSDARVLARFPEAVWGRIREADLKKLGYAGFEPFVPCGLYHGLTGRGRVRRTNTLYLNGRRLTPARGPNEGFVNIEKVISPTGFVFTAKLPELPRLGKADAPDLVACGYFQYLWDDENVRAEVTDPKKGVVKIDWLPEHEVVAGRPFYLRDAPALLDAPGEWYLDRESGKLYLLEPECTDGEYVFAGFSGPFVEVRGAQGVRIEGLTFEFGRGDAVVIEDCREVDFDGNLVRNFGGIGLQASGSRIRIRGNVLRGFGFDAMRVTGGDRKTLTPSGIVVEGNDVSDTGFHQRCYTPGILLNGCGTKLAYNHFHDLPSSAMRVEGNDYDIVSNLVERVVIESDDQGGSDTYGNPGYAGTVFRHNVWKNIVPEGNVPCGRAGIRFDDAISNQRVYGNRFIRCSAGGFGGVQIHGGRCNLVSNNLFVACRYGVSVTPWPQDRWRAFIDKGAFLGSEIGLDSPAYVARYPGIENLPDLPMTNSICCNVMVGAEREINFWGDGHATGAWGNRSFKEMPDAATLGKVPGFEIPPTEAEVGPRADDPLIRRARRNDR